MYVPSYLGLIKGAERQLADSLTLLADRHSRDPEVRDTAISLAKWSEAHIEALEPLAKRYGIIESEHPAKLRSALLGGTRVGGVGLLWDLQDLQLLITQVMSSWLILHQAATEKIDHELIALCKKACDDVERQNNWVKTLMKNLAPQAVVVLAEPGSELVGSIPEYPSVAAMPDPVWGPIGGGVLVLLVGLLGVLFGQQPWLAPSLGPTAYLQAVNPAHPHTRWYNTIVGHITGLVAGFAAVALLNAWDAPNPLVDKQLVLVRVIAAVLALALTLLIGHLVRAAHPPAGATTLLVALGSLKTPQDIVNLIIGAAIIALAGELMRRLRLDHMLSRTPQRPKVPKAALR